MEAVSYLEALEAATHLRELDVIPIETGLINQTYKVSDEKGGTKFLLQQINKDVFSNPELVQDNYEKIWSHLKFKTGNDSDPVVTIPAPLPFLDGSLLFVDKREMYWRIFELIDHAQTIDEAASPSQGREVAQTFGALTAAFESYDIELLAITIPGFHDLSLRFNQFKEALRTRDFERLQKAAPVIEQFRQREHYVSFYEVMISSPAFEKRLMHHDAKISNILFNENTGKLICPVDFDTCMPGYFFSDLGDMIRSMAAGSDESNVDHTGLTIRKEYYDAIVNGYVEVMGAQLTEAEKNYIHYAGLLMIYMQGLRFMTDFLQSDAYYRIDYPDQNYDRANNQFILLQNLEKFLKEHYPVNG